MEKPRKIKELGINTKDLESIKISSETKKLWKNTQEAGIRFEIEDRNSMHLKTDFDNMHISNTTYAEVQKTKIYFESCIKKSKNELIKLVLFRTRLEELLHILESSEIDETNSDLIDQCIKTISEKYQD
ncbi:MAG: hypothetical protein OXH39_19845 [Candidatus Poribacteria bacterium]|nr:hypothetical protein [Candidatus Poribacteria bacterium]